MELKGQKQAHIELAETELEGNKQLKNQGTIERTTKMKKKVKQETKEKLHRSASNGRRRWEGGGVQGGVLRGQACTNRTRSGKRHHESKSISVAQAVHE